MTKSIWYLLPRQGSLDLMMQFLHKYSNKCQDVVINRHQLAMLENARAHLTALNVGEDLKYRFCEYKPDSYQTALIFTLPHTRQLARPARSGSVGKGGYIPDHDEDGKRFKPKRAKQVAKEMICMEVLVNHLGQSQYNKVIRDYASNSDLLYAYCNKQNLPMPGVLVHCTQDTAPLKYTGIVSSLLIKEPGVVRLKGDVHETCGRAIASSFFLLDRTLTVLRLEQQLSHQSKSVAL